jgi:predicted SprT family Zn-dependent metalloprotease
MTIEDIKKECVDTFKLVNLEFKDIDVNINSRLTSAFGKCSFKIVGGKVVPKRLEFSKKMLETATPQSIKDVIKHECAHAIACIETGEKQGHNSYFKSVCARIGTKNDKPYAQLDRIVPDNQIYKYFVTCSCCGKVIKYQRAGKIIKNINNYRCKCGGSLKVIQNF